MKKKDLGNPRGRPRGIKKDDRLYVVISSDLKNRFQNAVEFDETNISVKTCELILDYVRKTERSKKGNEG